MKPFKSIPKTSIDKYISGYEALNTPSKDNMTADWHPRVYWGEPVDKEIPLYSNPLLGDKGIEYRKIMYSDEPVYIANFARAYADLVYSLPDSRLNILIGDSNDFLSADEQVEAYEYLKMINEEKDIEWLLRKEFTKLYFQDWIKRVGEE